MLGFRTVLKGMTRPVGTLHGTNRYKCDSRSFLHRENPTAMGAIAVTAAQRPSSKSIGNRAYKVQEPVTRWVMTLHPRFPTQIQCWMSSREGWLQLLVRETCLREQPVHGCLQSFPFNIWSIKDVSPDFRTGRWEIPLGQHLSHLRPKEPFLDWLL